MRGRDFLEVVEYLLPLRGEASIRAQIGRLYYAAYLESRTWCEANLGYERLQYAREHADVQRMLAAIDSDLATKLKFMRTYRNTADYDLRISLATLELQLVNARDWVQDIFQRLEALSSPQVNEPDAPGGE